MKRSSKGQFGDIALFGVDSMIIGCSSASLSERQELSNSVTTGFDAAGSDLKAIEIADRVMDAMSGRNAWENTRYIKWNFFGCRKHV